MTFNFNRCVSHLALKCNLSVCLLNTLCLPDYVCVERCSSVVFVNVIVSISNQRSLNNSILDRKRLGLCCEIEYRSRCSSLWISGVSIDAAISKNSTTNKLLRFDPIESNYVSKKKRKIHRKLLQVNQIHSSMKITKRHLPSTLYNIEQWQDGKRLLVSSVKFTMIGLPSNVVFFFSSLH